VDIFFEAKDEASAKEVVGNLQFDVGCLPAVTGTWFGYPDPEE